MYLILYNGTGFFMALHLLLAFVPEAIGVTDPLVSTYALPKSTERVIYQFSELLAVIEVFNHIVGIQSMKRHIFLFSAWALFIVFMVIPFYSSHSWVIYWVVIRSFRKLLRHLHKMYLDLGFRHEVYPLEALCINGLSFSFPIEYLISVIIILVTFPVARHSSALHFSICSCMPSLDLSLFYLIGLFVSIPYFLSTLVYVCRKRDHQITQKVVAHKKRYV